MTTFKSSNLSERGLSHLEPSDHLYRLLVESVADYAIFVSHGSHPQLEPGRATTEGL